MMSDYSSFMSTFCGFVVGVGMAWFTFTGTNKSKKNSQKGLLSGKYVFDEPGPSPNSEYKLAIIARGDLKMTKGKAIAQCCHAAVKAPNKVRKTEPEFYEGYLKDGRPKVILKSNDSTKLDEMIIQATKVGLQITCIKDAGRTQLAPGSLTVIGIGPGPSAAVDTVISNLKPF